MEWIGRKCVFPWDVSRPSDPSGPNGLLPDEDKGTWLRARDSQLRRWPQSQESSLPGETDWEQWAHPRITQNLGYSVSVADSHSQSTYICHLTGKINSGFWPKQHPM